MKFAKVMFLHGSVCPQGGSLSPHPGGGEGSDWGGGRGLQAHTRGEVGGSGGWRVSSAMPEGWVSRPRLGGEVYPSMH